MAATPDFSSIRTEEGSLTTPDDLRLYTKTWFPAVPVQARLVFLHGFSDHCNWYDELFRRLCLRGIKVYSFDQRGWGRSVHVPLQKGLTGPTEQVMADITLFIQHMSEKDEGHLPLFLAGHSMGGGEALVYLATGPPEVVSTVTGVLVESPFLAQPPATRASKALVVAGRLASKFFPHRQMLQKLDRKYMSRDADVCKAWEEDELNHDTGTLEGLAGMLDRGAGLMEGRVVLKEGRGAEGKTRLWVGHGTADGVADYDSVRTWFKSLQVEDKQLVAYEGWFHKLHSEPGEDKVRFADDVTSWILERSKALDTDETRETKAKL